jgi:hypothetical protein
VAFSAVTAACIEAVVADLFRTGEMEPGADDIGAAANPPPGTGPAAARAIGPIAVVIRSGNSTLAARVFAEPSVPPAQRGLADAEPDFSSAAAVT